MEQGGSQVQGEHGGTLKKRRWSFVPAWPVLGAIVFGLPAGAAITGVPIFGYLKGDLEQFVVTFGMAYGATVIGMIVATLLRLRAWRPAKRWLENPRSGAPAQAAWKATVEFPRRVYGLGWLIISAVSVPPVIAYWVAQFDLGPLEAVGSAVGGMTGLTAGIVLQLHLMELALQPLLARISLDLPDDWEGPRWGWNPLTRVLLAFSTLAGTAAIIAGAVTPVAGTPGTRLAIAVAASVGAAVLICAPLMFVSTGSILAPLRQLRAGTSRVSQGDFGTPVPLVAADELGELATSFNRMQHGLAEREQLAAENVGLQEQVRAQLEEVTESRARIVSASDAERRRVERNLHDGAQQRLVALALRLSLLEDSAEGESQRSMAAAARADLEAALAELRELARGLHPQVLSTGGLQPALKQLAERSPFPVEISAPEERFSEHVESTVFFVASEALANAAKYAQASSAAVKAERRNGLLTLEVTDDGVGGADPSAGTGLTGLSDRVAALSGRLSVESPPGAGTRVVVELPLGDPGP